MRVKARDPVAYWVLKPSSDRSRRLPGPGVIPELILLVRQEMKAEQRPVLYLLALRVKPGLLPQRLELMAEGAPPILRPLA